MCDMMSSDLRVVIFSGDREALVARGINEWLAEHEVDVVDIKYQTTSSGGDNHHRYWISAMLLYKQPK